jgi:hypothetical protein
MQGITPRLLSLVCASAALSLAPLAAFANVDKKVEEARIEAAYKASRTGCDVLSGNAKDICVADAKGQRAVAEADLKYRLTNDAADMRKLHLARAEASYEVAIERCDDKGGNEKDICRQQAKAERTAAEAEAKQHKAVNRANTEASEAKKEAYYKAEVEKCDALSGDAKTACVAAAKSKYGQ